MSFLKIAKRTALAMTERSGVAHVVRRSNWRRQRLTILCYHGISLDREHEWKPSLYMSPDNFAERLRILREGAYAVLPLHDALLRLSAGTLPRGAVSLTFDDGTHDFYARAAPLLEEFGFPATVYLTTYYSDFDGPVFGVFCAYMLWLAREKGGEADLGQAVPGAASADLSTSAGRDDALAVLNDHAMEHELTVEQRDSLIDSLAAVLDVDVRGLRQRRVLQIMSPGEARALARRGFDFQLHTHRHRVPLDRALFMREIRDNRRRLEELTGRTPIHFCYPSGVYRAEYLPWLAEAGIASATTCVPGVATRNSAPLLLPRIVDGAQLSPVEFRGWLEGTAAFLPRRVTHQERAAVELT